MRTPSAKLPHPSLLEFPTIWWKTVTDVRVYRSLIHLSTAFSLLYSFLLYGVLAILAALVFQFRTLPAWQNTALATWEEFRTSWPEQMVMRYADNTLTLENISEPFVVPYPSALSVPDTFPRDLAFVSTDQPANEGALNDLNANVLVALTADRLVIQPNAVDEISDTNSSAWSDLLGDQTFTVRQADLKQHSPEVETALARGLQLLVLPFFFISWWGLWLARVGLLLLYALFAQTLFWMFGTRIRYLAVFRLGLYTLPVIELLPLLWKGLYGSVLWSGSFWWIWLIGITFLAWYNRRGKILEV